MPGDDVSDVEGTYQGRHFSQSADVVREMKRNGQLAEALVILAGCREATNRESKARGWDRPAPFYWTEAAKVLASQGSFDEAISLLQEYLSLCGDKAREDLQEEFDLLIGNLVARKQTAAFTGSEAVCPSCGVLLDELPARSRKCPACDEKIVRRTLNGKPLLLTVEEDEDFGAAKKQRAQSNKVIELARRADITLADLERVTTELQARWGAVPSDADVLWNALNQKLTEHMRTSNWVGLRQVYNAQTRVLASEGRDWMVPASEAVRADLMVLGARISPDEILIMKGCKCDTCTRTQLRKTLEQALQNLGIPHADCEKAPCKCYYVPERGYDAFIPTTHEIHIVVAVEPERPRGLLGRLLGR